MSFWTASTAWAAPYKVRESGTVKSRAIYNILGVNREGKKELLGIYVSENEGAKFWLSVLTDLKQRGVQDIFIACIDGLKGFPEAIEAAFPQTRVQLCIVHQIRTTLRFVAEKDKKEVAADIKPIYKAVNAERGFEMLLEFEAKWGQKYPLAVKSWVDNWDNLSAFFEYDTDIRRTIYTTNAIEGVHRQIRKVTKTKPGGRCRGFHLRYGPTEAVLPGCDGHHKEMDAVAQKLALDHVAIIH